MAPGALCRKGELPLDGATTEDLERNSLLYVSRRLSSSNLHRSAVGFANLVASANKANVCRAI
jgi:hypothetical protein